MVALERRKGALDLASTSRSRLVAKSQRCDQSEDVFLQDRRESPPFQLWDETALNGFRRAMYFWIVSDETFPAVEMARISQRLIDTSFGDFNGRNVALARVQQNDPQNLLDHCRAANPKARRYRVGAVAKKIDNFQNSFSMSLSYNSGSAQDMGDGRCRNSGGSRNVDHGWVLLRPLPDDEVIRLSKSSALMCVESGNKSAIREIILSERFSSNSSFAGATKSLRSRSAAKAKQA